jgi:hypothetical protein
MIIITRSIKVLYWDGRVAIEMTTTRANRILKGLGRTDKANCHQVRG